MHGNSAASVDLDVRASWRKKLQRLFAPRKPAASSLFNDAALMEMGFQEHIEH